MSKPVPKHISRHYEDGARGFRAEKRQQLAEVNKLAQQLRVGCAYFPGGGDQMDRLYVVLDEIEKNLSREVWGQ